jgi:hypothetical protein
MVTSSTKLIRHRVAYVIIKALLYISQGILDSINFVECDGVILTFVGSIDDPLRFAKGFEPLQVFLTKLNGANA